MSNREKRNVKSKREKLKSEIVKRLKKDICKCNLKIKQRNQIGNSKKINKTVNSL